MLKINKETFWGDILRAPKPPLKGKIRNFGPPITRPKIIFEFFFNILYFYLDPKFSSNTLFLFYNDFKRFYDTFKKICVFCKKICILYSKICQKGNNVYGLCAFGEKCSLNLKKIFLAIIWYY